MYFSFHLMKNCEAKLLGTFSPTVHTLGLVQMTLPKARQNHDLNLKLVT